MQKNLKLKLVSAVIAALLTAAILGCSSHYSTDSIPAVKNFNVNKYMGKWYEIARLPHSFEDDVSDAQADYTLLKNGNIEVKNSGFRHGIPVAAYGIARSADRSGSGELEVSFFGPFYGMYKIIYLNQDYTLAIVSGSTLNYVWILARKPFISRSELALCLEMLKKWGFAVNLLQYPTGMVESLVIPTDRP